MSAAIVILILSIIVLSALIGFFLLRMGWLAIEVIVAFVRHELMMRPQNVYFRM